MVLLGWAVRNLAAAPAVLTITDADGPGPAVTFPVTLAASASGWAWFGDAGVLMLTGAFLAAAGGEIVGSLFYDAGTT